MVQFDFTRRTRDCQSALVDVGADAAIVSPSPDMEYLTGFTDEPDRRLLFLVVLATGESVFIVPEMYREQIADATEVEDVRTWPWRSPETAMDLVEALLSEHDLRDGTLLLEDRMWATFVGQFHAYFPDATFGLASDVLEDLRIRKTDEELRALEEAGSLSDEVAEEIRGLGADVVGMTERELAFEIKTRLRDHGSTGVAFEPMVGAGPNSAKPHHRHSDRVIREGDPVMMDFGGIVDGYLGDQTRTLVFGGEPPAEFEDVHETVLEAHERGVDAVAPRVTAETVDEAAREVIEAAGYGDAYYHRTGHGVGLELHEPPFLKPNNDRELEPGMVCSVEPGVYLAGRFGVRIEDLVVVTESGCERINDTPRTWEP
ncbi:M24 family metallopeptidase [Halobellus rufus]|uniref:M24 family metallopeptidase n=1 Tax=Halobellus rufus TaxID=1448860 RepID=UPI00067927BB|nr:Xaa-Pro peptidase family protein [Halobellus rufus]